MYLYCMRNKRVRLLLLVAWVDRMYKIVLLYKERGYIHERNQSKEFQPRFVLTC